MKILFKGLAFSMLCVALLIPDGARAAGQTEPGGNPSLGVRVTPPSPALVAQLGGNLQGQKGVLVQAVLAGSPADLAGVEQYDLLLSYDDQRLVSPDQLVQLVRSDEPGREVSLDLLRGGDRRILTVPLGGEAKEHAKTHHFWDMADELAARFPHTTPDHAAPVYRERFSALSLRNIGDGRYRAEVEYLGTDGQHHQEQIEGTREELRTKIAALTEVPKGERGDLLSGLEAPVTPRIDTLWPDLTDLGAFDPFGLLGQQDCPCRRDADASHMN